MGHYHLQDETVKIREIALTNFKRFTHAIITGIPESARLVLLVGPTGCGKSSLIDAVLTWHRNAWANRGTWDESYHSKGTNSTSSWQGSVQVSFHNPQP